MSRFDAIVVGELNVDLVLDDIARMPEIGKELLAGTMVYTLGSSSAIFASSLSSLGLKVAFIGKCGTDIQGDFVLDSLKEKGVCTDYIQRSRQWPTGITVALNFGEERAAITYPGAMAHLQLSDIADHILAGASHLHLSSCFLQKKLLPGIPDLFKKSKRLGLSTSVDPQWDPDEQWDLDLAELLPYVDVFLPNERELLRLTRTTNLDEAIARIRPYVNTAAIKRGALGSVYLDKEHAFYQPAFLNTEVADAIGAGDNFNAGFIFEYLLKSPIIQCQKFGNLVAAVSTTVHGGTGAYSTYDNLIKLAGKRFGYAG